MTEPGHPSQPDPRIQILLDENENDLAPHLDPARFDVVRSVDRLGEGAPDNKVTNLAANEQRWLITQDRGITPKVRNDTYAPAHVVVTSPGDTPAERARKIDRHLPARYPHSPTGVMVDVRHDKPRLLAFPALTPPRPGPTPRPPQPKGPRP